LSDAREKKSSRSEDQEARPKKDSPKRTHLGLSADRAKNIKNKLEDADFSKVGKAEPIRLNRYISNSGVCSRREADELIEAGVITVNGKVVTELGVKVSPDDEVRYDGQRIYPEKFRYVLLNKPKDYITTLDDPEGRQTVMFLVRKACKERIYPVGRLDRATTGLLLLTNDGDLAKRLTHPSHGVQKIYHVELDQKVDPTHLQKMREGIMLEDGMIKADDVAFTGDGEDKKSVGIEIHSGRNRIVRRMFEYFGYNVKKLDRVVFAGLTKKDLPRGEHRHLTEKEVAFLHMLTGKGR
jgi:23S rRNA pseudouridine2605 synthase